MTILLFEKYSISLGDIIASFLYNEIKRRSNLEGGHDFGLIGQVENYKEKSSMRRSENCKCRSRSKSRGKNKV